MLKLKKAILALVSLLALALSLNLFTGDAQTRRGGATSSPEQSKGRSTLVGLPPRQGVNYSKFDHTTHSLNCEDCHVIGPGVKEAERVTQFPKHPACDKCHSIQMFALKQEFCLICHDLPRKVNWPAKTTFPDQRPDQFSVKFPHSVHDKLDVNDFNQNKIDLLEGQDEKARKIQAIAKNSGCLECHVKDGKDKKEEKFSEPHHPECARCHGVAPKKVAPNMYQCLDCHKPWLPIRTVENGKIVTNIVPKFRHDSDHEDDTRPGAKKGAKLECQFCHKQAAKSARLFDIEVPLVSNCTVCHNNDKKAVGHELTPAELAHLKPDKK